MARHVLLNNVEHKSLRVITTRAARYGDDVMYAVTFPAEFRDIQSSYPIVFQKRGDTGEFQPIALLGFEPRENLFLTESGWDATYVPMTIERLPFLIGFQSPAEPGAEPQLMIHADLDSPRISATAGEPLFRDYGGTTEYLDRISSMLRSVHDGLATTPAFIAALLASDLLESFALDVTLKDGSEHRLAGFYAVNEERLQALDGSAIAALHAQGFLQPIYMTLASVTKFSDLIKRRNRRLDTDRS